MVKRLIFIVSLVLLFSGCSSLKQPEPVSYVDLSKLESLPTPARGQVPLRVAVAAVISPQGTVESYADFISYLSEATGRPVELEQRRTYLEVNEMLELGEIDLAVVCTGAYILGKDDFSMELLVAPQVNGETVYYSVLIVPIDSQAQDITDLQGKVFAFTDPISLTGRLYPTSIVQELGYQPEEYFGKVFFTYSHDEAIYAVANNIADGANVDSLVYEYAVSRDPSLLEKTKIIHTSQPFGIPPVVVNPDIRPQVKQDLQDLFLNMKYDVLGQKALFSLGTDEFVLIEDEVYDDARELIFNTYINDNP